LESSLRGERLHLWRGEKHVLRGVDFELCGGEALQVQGPNGSGKTTLLRALCGLVQPEEGRVLWNGADVRRVLPSYHAALAYIGHESPLKGDLTAHENLRFWASVRKQFSTKQVDAALERVGGIDWRDRTARTLSAGQRRRVGLAALMLLGAAIWILDEPTTNLDAHGREVVTRMIRDHLQNGGLVVAAVHQELELGTVNLRRLDLH
jgi:heme exporter protein A